MGPSIICIINGLLVISIICDPVWEYRSYCLSILKYQEMLFLSIQCVVVHQWLTLCGPNFHTFYTISLSSRASTVQVANSKFPAILDNF